MQLPRVTVLVFSKVGAGELQGTSSEDTVRGRMKDVHNGERTSTGLMVDSPGSANKRAYDMKGCRCRGKGRQRIISRKDLTSKIKDRMSLIDVLDESTRILTSGSHSGNDAPLCRVVNGYMFGVHERRRIELRLGREVRGYGREVVHCASG